MNETAPSLAIVEANAQSIDDVMAVMDQAFDANFGEAWRREQCLGILGLPGVWLSVGMVDEQVAGFALSRIVLDEAELLLIAVSPTIRRQGLGSLLLDYTINSAAKRGATRLHLEVRDGNPAFTLYKRFGFNPVGRRSAYYKGGFGQSFDALTLMRPITIA